MRIREYLVKGASAINICFSLVNLMGGKGNDPFDHEQKFPRQAKRRAGTDCQGVENIP